MRYLADTHAVVWWAEDSPRLSRRARSILADRDSQVLWSVAGAWELAIKHSLGRLELRIPLAEFLDVRLSQQGVDLLPIEPAHLVRLVQLPHHHGDPFDRMLVAQVEASA